MLTAEVASRNYSIITADVSQDTAATVAMIVSVN